MKNLIVFFGLFVCSLGFAQQRILEGMVLDGAFENEALGFASVSVKGLDISTETSLEGDFSLALVEGNYTLIIDFIGYAPVEIENVVVDANRVSLEPIVLNAIKPSSYDLAVNSNDE